MKKIICLVMLAAALLFVFSCKPPGGETNPYAAPEVKTSTDLPASGAAGSPATESDAIALYSGALAAFGQALGTEAGLGNVKSKATTTIGPTTIDWTGAYGGGTINVTGSVSGSQTFPDQTFVPTPGVEYKDIIAVIMNAVINGTITDVTFTGATGDSYSYTVNGDLTETMDIDFSVDMTLNTDSTVTGSMDLMLGLSYGTAFTILRTGGGVPSVGAKFIITFGGKIDAQNVPLTSQSEMYTSLMDQMASKTATLQVYDDSNNLIYSATLTLNDLVGSQMGIGGI